MSAFGVSIHSNSLGISGYPQVALNSLVFTLSDGLKVLTIASFPHFIAE
jgi:hypothetical protein